MSRTSGRWQQVESTSLGPGRAREQRRGGAGEAIRQVNERHPMFVMNSRSTTLEHTYFGHKGQLHRLPIYA
eukprot:9238806-Pyramimonas_sp.AAC.1